MNPQPTSPFVHPTIGRRAALQAGGIGLLGLGMNHVDALSAADIKTYQGSLSAKSVIYIFLSGGLAQHDSFDMKPNAPRQHSRRIQPDRDEDPGPRDL